LRPALTVVSQPIYDLGRQSAELLLRRIGGEQFPPRQVVLPTTLMVRGSSQRRRTLDPRL
jgi:LacI family transcriptional regulator, galactose operon repressor